MYICIHILKCRNDVSSYHYQNQWLSPFSQGSSWWLLGHPAPRHTHCSSVASVAPAPYTPTDTSPGKLNPLEQ